MNGKAQEFGGRGLPLTDAEEGPGLPGHPFFDLAMQSPHLIRTRDYWLSLCAGRAMPRPGEFILTDIPECVPNLIIVDVHHDPLAMQFRLLGTYVTDLVGRNSTGRWMDKALFPDNLEEIIWAYRHCAQSGRPLATAGPVDIAENAWTGAEVLFLPLSSDGEHVTRIASCYDMLDPDHVLPDPALEVIINWQQ